jgi:hypothetical protein
MQIQYFTVQSVGATGKMRLKSMIFCVDLPVLEAIHPDSS